MSAISLKSITGITSITTPAGVDNVFTVHTNDTTERFRVDSNGNQRIAGILTVTQDLDVDGHTNLDNISVAGVSTFAGNADFFAGIDVTGNATVSGNLSVGGVLTYEDVTNIDSVGIITARDGIDCNADLDVDGHTELDNVNIAGIVTVSNTAPGVHFIDTNANSDFMAQVDTGVFKIVDLTNSSATRVLINSAGKVGINEVNPSEMLHIKAEDNTDNFGGIIVKANNNSVYTKHGWRGLDSNEAIRFAISGTEKMRLTNGGKLALGRTGADEMLHITHDDNSDHYGGIKIAANNNSVHVKYGWRGIDGSETLRFAIGGTEKLRITSAGLVGIATDAPTGAWLDIATGSGTYDHIRMRRISSDVNIASNWSLKPYGGNLYFREGGSTDKIVFTDDGTVGINDASPNTYFKLDVNGHTNIVGDIALPTTNRIYFGNSDTAFIKGEHGGSAYLAFGANNEKMRLIRDGNLLLGTSTAAISGGIGLLIANSAGGRIKLCDSDLGVTASDGFELIASDNGTAYVWNRENTSLLFGTNNSERLRITTTGELGVNTTAPVEKLGISGNIRFVNPNGNTSRITALPSGSYSTGTSGGSAICFQRIADGGGGSDEIFFETHWQGNRHGESMRINKYGHVTKPQNPAFKAVRTSNQTVTSNGWHIIQYNSDSATGCFDVGGNFDTSNHRFTAPVTGYYQFGLNQRIDGGNGDYFRVAFTVDGGGLSGQYPYGHAIYRDTDGFNYYTFSITSLIYLTAGQYVRAEAYSASDNLWYLQDESQFYGYLVG